MLRLVWIAVPLLLAGCNLDVSLSPTDAVDAEGGAASIVIEELPQLTSRAWLLDAEPVACIDKVEVRDGGLLVSGLCAVSFDVDQLVVGPNVADGGGFLRRIDAVEETGDGTWLTTSSASVAEALDEPVQWKESLAFSQRRASVDLSGIELYDSTHLTAWIESGSIRVDPTVDVEVDFGLLGLDEATVDVYLDGEASIEVMLAVHGAYSYDKTTPVGSVSYPFATAVGPIPLYGAVEVSFEAGFGVATAGEATVTAGATVDYDVDAFLAYSDGEFSSGWNDELGLDAMTPELTIDASASAVVSVVPHVRLVLYEAAGAGLTPAAYAVADAYTDGTYVPFDVTVGVDVDADLALSVLDYEIASKEWDLFDWETSLLADTDGDGMLDSDDCDPTDPLLHVDCSSTTPTTCASDEVEDCNGGCTADAKLGNGVCNSALDCATHNNDEGDCSTATPTTCASDEVEDCDGNCEYASYVGDTICDSNLDCATHNYDEGDCTTAPTCASDEVEDCDGNCAPASYLGDDYCDSNLDCATHDYDEGDCPIACVDHADCDSDEICDPYGTCLVAMPWDYRVEILWASSEYLTPDGYYWDIDYSNPDIVIGFGTSSEYFTTDIASNTLDATFNHAETLTLDGSTFTVEFYDSDIGPDDLGASWSFDTDAELMTLAELNGTSYILSDSTGWIQVALSVEAL
jgi:hypothetical protein